MISCFVYMVDTIYIAYDITGIYLTIKNVNNDKFQAYLMRGNGMGRASPTGTRVASFYLQYEQAIYERLLQLQNLQNKFRINVNNNLIEIKIKLNQNKINKFMECIFFNYQNLRPDFGANPLEDELHMV